MLHAVSCLIDRNICNMLRYQLVGTYEHQLMMSCACEVTIDVTSCVNFISGVKRNASHLDYCVDNNQGNLKLDHVWSNIEPLG